MGQRMILPTGAFGAYTQTPIENYHRLRLTLGLADGSRDIVVEKYFLLEANFEELNGVDFKKGCYVGQELVSRMKHRGVVRKRLFPVSVEGPCPPPGTSILAAGREVGVLHSSQDARALAFLRLAALAPGAPELTCGEARLSLALPAWLKLTFPETGDDQD
jgi:folate-binding protein YgfZ